MRRRSGQVKPRIQVGDWVRLKKRVGPPSHGKAQVELLYPDIEGGVKLKTPLAGFYSWNVTHLVRLSRPRHYYDET